MTAVTAAGYGDFRGNNYEISDAAALRELCGAGRSPVKNNTNHAAMDVHRQHGCLIEE